jgi:hypothetical protein
MNKHRRFPRTDLVWSSSPGGADNFSCPAWLAFSTSPTVTYLSDRYAIPQELAGNLAVVDAVIEQALTP